MHNKVLIGKYFRFTYIFITLPEQILPREKIVTWRKKSVYIITNFIQFSFFLSFLYEKWLILLVQSIQM